MRFIPATFMGARGECVKAYSNGSISGSFESGSRIFAYHEFKLANDLISSTFQLIVEQGYTTDARAIVIGGGGGGGWDGTDSYGRGGGGGGGNVLDSHQVVLSPGTFSIRVGAGGNSADADNSSPSLRTYNGGNGDYSTITGAYVSLQANGGQGGQGKAADADYLYGGESGTPFAGGLGVTSGAKAAAGGGGGCTEIGSNGAIGTGGDGGDGKTIILPYTSSTWNSVTKQVGGGGGGSIDTGGTSGTEGAGVFGGGKGSDSQISAGVSGTRYTGGGGGGGAAFAYTPPAGLGTTGGDGFVIIYYPITDCFNEGSGSFQLANSLFNVCTTPTATTLYYNKMFYTGLQTGSVLYTDKALLSPVSSSYIITGSEVYVISGSNGLVTSTTVCSSTVSFASGSATGSACTSNTFNNYYYTGSLIVGTTIYTDYARTNLVPNDFYKRSGTFDLYQTITGVVNLITTCSIDCKNITFRGNNDGGPITFYNCSGSFQSTSLNRLNVFNTCANVNAPITTGGSVTYTTGSAC